MASEALRITSAVTIGALLLLGFAFYRYTAVSRKKKREDEDETDSESSIEIKKVDPLSSAPLDSGPKNYSNVSISITKNNKDQQLNESDRKDEARRIIQKVLSEDMIKKGVPEASKKLLEDTLENLNDSGSLRATSPRSLSSEKSPESSRYVPFEEVLKRKSMERSPTPTKSGSSSLSPESMSPSKSYVYLSREPSFTRESKSASPPKEPASPSFELFKSKRTSVEKEITEVFSSNVNGSPRQTSPEEFKSLIGFASSKNDSGVNSNSSLNEFPKEPEAPSLSHVLDPTPLNKAEEETAGADIETKPTTQAEDSFLSNDQAATLEDNMPSSLPENAPTADANVLQPTVQEAQPDSIDTSSNDGPSSFEILDLKPRVFEEENVNSQISGTDILEDIVLEAKKEDSTPIDIPPPPLETLETHSDESSSTDKFSMSTNFRPSWASITKESNGGHVWEKGVAVKGKSIPKSNPSGEEDDEMNLLSKSQEKELHSKAPLLSDSDEEEVKPVKENQVPLSKPMVMEDIREESEEPEDGLNQQTTSTAQGTKQQKSKGRSKKKKHKN